MDTRSEFAQRLARFHDEYTEEESDTFVRSLIVLGDMVEVGFGKEKAAEVMASALWTLTGSKADELTEDWLEAWQGLDGGEDTAMTPAMMLGRDVHAFAFYGILESWALDKVPEELELSRSDVPAHVLRGIDRLEYFMRLFGKESRTWGFDVISKTILAAQGRLKLDSAAPLSVHELAALGRVIPKSIQNAIYAGSEGAPVVRDGLIVHASAQRWLEGRDYLPSIWQEFDPTTSANLDEGLSLSDDAHEDEVDQFLFVPEAPDGSIFAPSCGVGPDDKKRFMIGGKGAERPVVGYDAALAELTKMVSPHWRRPNSNGNRGVVKAARWRRISRAELANL